MHFLSVYAELVPHVAQLRNSGNKPTELSGTAARRVALSYLNINELIANPEKNVGYHTLWNTPYSLQILHVLMD